MITGIVAALALLPAVAVAKDDDHRGDPGKGGSGARSEDHGKDRKDDDTGRGHGGGIPGGIGGGHSGGGGGPTVQTAEPIALLMIGAGLLGAVALRRKP
jgi:hypothetical protein